MSNLFGSSQSGTDPVASQLALQLFGLARGQLRRQNKFRREFVEPFLRALGLPDADIGKLGPVFSQMFAQELEQIGQSFGSAQGSLIDQLASSGFRTGSQAAGQTQLALGQAQSEVNAKRTALLNQLASLFQGANIATGNVATFNPQGLFAPTPGFFRAVSSQSAGLAPVLSALGQGAQGAGAAGGLGAFFCWIAEVLYGRNDIRVWMLRLWFQLEYQKTLMGKMVMKVYQTWGQSIARFIETRPTLQKLFRPLFNHWLRRAESELFRDMYERV